MIDRAKWTRYWRLMEDRWGRKSDDLSEFYRRELELAGVDTDGAGDSVRRVLTNEDYFPSVRTLAGYVPGLQRAVSAVEAWTDVRKLLTNPGSSLDHLPAAARKAVRAMGGLGAIGARVSELDWKRREFCELYDAYSDPRLHDPELAIEAPVDRKLLAAIMEGGEV